MTDSTFVVLLRGVNLGPHRRVAAADLRTVAQDAGLTAARTVLNSGNVVGRAAAPAAAAAGAAAEAQVAARVAAALERRLGQQVPAVAITAGRLAEVVAANPFPDAARDDPAHLLAFVPAGPVDADGIARLAREHPGPERLALAAGALVVEYPAGLAASRLTSARIDRAAGTWLTGRNWNTVTRLLALARELGG
ncbi:DUF1697 domain-containing protein [Puerhibacterium puerhi]|uniref:DUF1697 domain-containing protein n=1 Tax=Puerhibacterium puerhi TaxID=2692623 RepID=UPI00135787A7|nr:DUF1697 domain-containing protein [Puerhibacterium puerhi]